jgi:RNA polymerase sigma-70 factor (ECF subfamily)
MEATLTALRMGRVHDLDLLDRYVLGVCRNVAHTLRRAGERADQAARRLALEPAPTPERPPEAPWGTHLVERLTPCLAGLTRREQGVVQLSFSERRSSTEIAEQFGVTPGNVRVIRHRALRKLRDCLDRGADPT